MPGMSNDPEGIGGGQLPDEMPKMDAMQEMDPVVGSVGATVGKAEVAASHEATIPGKKGKSSMVFLMPVLIIMVVFAIWAFMPTAMDPALSKLGKVTDKGAFYEIEHKGDAADAQRELQDIYELIAEKAKPNEGKLEVAVFSGASTTIEVVGAQGVKPTIIRVMKGRNLDKLGK